MPWLASLTISDWKRIERTIAVIQGRQNLVVASMELGEKIWVSQQHIKRMLGICVCFQNFDYDLWISFEWLVAQPASSQCDMMTVTPQRRAP